MAVREYAGAAKRTTLASDITAGSAVLTVADATGWPTGATGPFAIALEMGAAGEEKVLILSRSGNTLTVHTRGYDDTTASSHLSGSTADHVLTAIDLREANAFINGGASAAYVVRAEAQTATVAANESTTSAALTDLATPGPAVTVTIGASGRALVILSATIYGNATTNYTAMAYAVSGATTVAASDARRLMINPAFNGQQISASAAFVQTGLTAGSNTFTSKYNADGGGTSNFLRRHITVIPL